MSRASSSSPGLRVAVAALSSDGVARRCVPESDAAPPPGAVACSMRSRNASTLSSTQKSSKERRPSAPTTSALYLSLAEAGTALQRSMWRATSHVSGSGRSGPRASARRPPDRGANDEDKEEEEEEDGGGGSKRRQNKFGRDTSGLDPDALDIVMGNGVRRGVRTATELGNAYFALEDETPFIIGHKLHVYGNQLVALNIWHLPGLKLRSKLREGTRLWLDPISEDERDTMQEELMSRCELVLNALQRHRFYGIFANPVDPVMLGIPDYLDVIKVSGVE